MPNPTYKVLITDIAWPTPDLERAILAEAGAELVVAQRGDADELIQLAAGVDAILTCWRDVPAAALEAAPHCLVVSRYGIGLDNIPVQQATELGMLVTNVPDFCAEEVSDHVMALLLASARRLLPYADGVRRGDWSQNADRPVPRLRGQTLGLIGYGTLAQAVAAKARAFGLRLIAYTPRLAADALGPAGTATNDLDLLLREADYISLHVPLTEQTRGLIDQHALRRMKPTAYLINTARGAVVDEKALVQALQEGWIAGAALDVLAQEPPDPANPLLHMDNVILTPHVAFYSETAIAELQRRAAEQVAQVLCGQIPAHVVNPAVLAQPNLRLKPAL